VVSLRAGDCLLEGVPSFVDELARRLVPTCDPAVVGAVLATATSGYAGPRLRNGRRASVLTPSGVPFEASVTGGGGSAVAALRYVTEAGTALPFFAPRLAAQRAVLDELAGWLPSCGQAARAELQSFVDTVFPDPAAAPARARFATFFGVVHQPDAPDRLAWLKLYGNLAGNTGALDRLARRWHEFARLRAAVADGAPLVHRFASLELAESDARRYKLYVRPREGSAATLDALMRRCGIDVADLPAALAGWRREVDLGARAYICYEAREGLDPATSVYLPVRELGLDAGGLGTLIGDLARSRQGSTLAVDALNAAAAASSGDWQPTVVGLGAPLGGRVGKLNLYVAPEIGTGSLRPLPGSG
jgi:hypothetical protein